MENNNILAKNELEANKTAAFITLITISFIALVYLLNVLGIFIAPQGPMTIAMLIATIMMLIPSLLVFLLKLTRKWVKYAIIVASTLMVMVMSLLLSWHVVILFIYPIAIACLYFSRKLSWFAVILSLILFSISQFASLYTGGVADHNLSNEHDMLLYGIAPRGIQLLALSIIFILLTKRTRKLLRNAVGAEEQKSTLEQIMTLTDKSYKVTNTLADSVKVLSEITDHTKRSNEEITKMTSNIVEGSQQTIKHVDEASEIVSSVTANLNKIAKNNNEISKVSSETIILTETNMINMKDAANEMQQINNATKDSRTIITRLGEKSSEIENIAQVIKSIAERTNLLSLNATIESAKAGENGKGFAVVASEIRTLADQSKIAADNISVLVQKVLEDTSEAVNSMDLNTKLVDNGLDLVDKADKSSVEVTKSIEKMNAMAQKIASLSTSVAQSGDQIIGAVDGISKLTNNNLEDLMTILDASKEQLKEMNEVAASVDSINMTSEELLDVVNKSKI